MNNLKMVSSKNGLYTFLDGTLTIEVDIELNKIWVTKNNRTYRTGKLVKSYEYLIKELEK